MGELTTLDVAGFISQGVFPTAVSTEQVPGIGQSGNQCSGALRTHEHLSMGNPARIRALGEVVLDMGQAQDVLEEHNQI